MLCDTFRGARTIVNIVAASMRVLGVVHDERPSQPVTVLRRQMAVVPERPCRSRRSMRTLHHTKITTKLAYLPGRAHGSRTGMNARKQ